MNAVERKDSLEVEGVPLVYSQDISGSIFVNSCVTVWNSCCYDSTHNHISPYRHISLLLQCLKRHNYTLL